MKALELLLQYQYADEIGGGMMKDELDEAIAELEELMKPKSCEGCKYSHFEPHIKYVNVKDECIECCFVCVRDCTDYYEPKEPL